MRSRQKSQNYESGWLLILVVLLTCFFYYFPSSKVSSISFSSTKKTNHAGIPKTHDQKVDAYLKQTKDRVELATSKMEIDNYYQAPEIEKMGALVRGSGDKELLEQYGVSTDQAGEAVSIYEQINSPSELPSVNDPEMQVNRQLLTRQIADEENEKARQAYVDEFVRNARQAGYKVILDGSRVKDVKKIKVRN